MKVTFTFSEAPNLSSLKRGDVLTSSFKFPDEALQQPDCKEHVLAIANLVGKLTWACLHLTCYELGLKDYPVKLTKNEGNISNRGLLFAAWSPMLLRFDRVRTPADTSYRAPYIGLKIIASLPLRARPVTNEQKALAEVVRLLGAHCVYLLNTHPDPSMRWEFTYLYPRFRDTAAIKRFKKRDRQRLRRERDAAEVASAAGSQGVPPSPRTGAGRRVGAVPGVFRGVQFRSQLEIRFATQLEARHIRWVYESERLGEGNYLVDFYLPDLKCWVEVKGKVEPRDDYLLKDIASYLANERHERLFVYTQAKAFVVSEGNFLEMSHAKFWTQISRA